ncbi:hypothetical protein [Polyangium mundeleinium]|uniref:SMI1/KNR4 family protein n=1 Tax=Polyangium mundeleinium TaxID=2995306 RepID=A0ABT5EJS4_9BACT|nr:hypothetical protein [Polyangium mundeleinium]MDC0742039.1 hypothetical protein [Polyangium mundeleinium]
MATTTNCGLASPDIYFVASDFDSFLRQLRAWTPEELAEIEALAAANAVELDPDKPAE